MVLTRWRDTEVTTKLLIGLVTAVVAGFALMFATRPATAQRVSTVSADVPAAATPSVTVTDAVPDSESAGTQTTSSAPVIAQPSTRSTATAPSSAPAQQAPVQIAQQAPTPSTRSFSGKLELVEAVDTGGENPTGCLTLSEQIVISDGSGVALAVSGTLSNAVMSDRDTNTSAFIANCTYSYTLANVPDRNLYKVTISGDLTDLTFSSMDPTQGEYVQAAQMGNGQLPTIIGDLKIGIS